MKKKPPAPAASNQIWRSTILNLSSAIASEGLRPFGQGGTKTTERDCNGIECLPHITPQGLSMSNKRSGTPVAKVDSWDRLGEGCRNA